MLEPDSGFGLMAVALPLIGVGNAFTTVTSLNVILSILPESHTGAGTALTRTLQQLAASLGVAILGSVLSSGYRSELANHVTALPGRLKDVAEGSVAGATLIAGGLPGPLRTAVLHAPRALTSSGWPTCCGWAPASWSQGRF